MSEFQKIISDFSPDDEQKNAILVGARQKAASRQKLPQKRVLAVAVLCCTLLAACGIKVWIYSEVYRQKVYALFDNISLAATYETYKFDSDGVHVELIGSTAGQNTVTLFYTVTTKKEADTDRHISVRFDYSDDRAMYGRFHPIETDADINTTLWRSTCYLSGVNEGDHLPFELMIDEVSVAKNIDILLTKGKSAAAENRILQDNFTGSVYLDSACLTVKLDFLQPNADITAGVALKFADDQTEAYCENLSASLIKTDGTICSISEKPSWVFGKSDWAGYVQFLFEQIIDPDEYNGVVINGQEIYF